MKLKIKGYLKNPRKFNEFFNKNIGYCANVKTSKRWEISIVADSISH